MEKEKELGCQGKLAAHFAQQVYLSKVSRANQDSLSHSALYHLGFNISSLHCSGFNPTAASVFKLNLNWNLFLN